MPRSRSSGSVGSPPTARRSATMGRARSRRVAPARGGGHAASGQHRVLTRAPLPWFLVAVVYWIPAAVQTLAPTAVQRSLAEMNLSLITVLSMFEPLTQTGVNSTAGSVVAGLAGSVVVPFTSAAGGVWPARR